MHTVEREEGKVLSRYLQTTEFGFMCAIAMDENWVHLIAILSLALEISLPAGCCAEREGWVGKTKRTVRFLTTRMSVSYKGR